jgi:hypothetical protein
MKSKQDIVKKPNHNPKTYMQRLREFEAGICPYCHAEGTTLTARTTKKGRVVGYSGHCGKCDAENNFTKPEVIERMRG